LEGTLEIVVANAQQVKKVPGRKTDVKDAEWLADLLCHGLLRSSFVPPERLQSVENDIYTLEQRIQHKLEPHAAQLALLDGIPGVDWTLAAVIIAELGIDMSEFENVSQLTSWAGVCPGNNESAGKRKSSRIPKGNFYLKTALVEAANAAAKAKGTYLRDKFYRLKARRGYKRAAVAIAHKILVAIYHMLSQQVSYHDLADLYLDKLNKHHLTRNLFHRL
jgi:transposase